MLPFSKAHLQLVSTQPFLSCHAKFLSQEREEEQRCVTEIDWLLATPPNGELARRQTAAWETTTSFPGQGLGSRLWKTNLQISLWKLRSAEKLFWQHSNGWILKNHVYLDWPINTFRRFNDLFGCVKIFFKLQRLESLPWHRLLPGQEALQGTFSCHASLVWSTGSLGKLFAHCHVCSPSSSTNGSCLWPGDDHSCRGEIVKNMT